MKFDMGGAAAALGTAKALGQIKPPGVEVSLLTFGDKEMIYKHAICFQFFCLDLRLFFFCGDFTGSLYCGCL